MMFVANKRRDVFQAHEGDDLVGSLTVDTYPAETEYPSDYGMTHGGRQAFMAPKFSDDDGQGRLFNHVQTPPSIDVAVVDRRYRRQGIASTLLDIANVSHRQEVVHSSTITPEAFAWARSRGDTILTDRPTDRSWSEQGDDGRVGDFLVGAPKEDLGGRRLRQTRTPRPPVHQPTLPGII